MFTDVIYTNITYFKLQVRYQSSQDHCADMAQKLEQHGVDLFPYGSEFVHNRLLDCSFF